MINIDKKEFENIINLAIESLPKNFIDKINNLAIFVEDYPTDEQIQKLGLNEKYGLFGIYEGYIQSKRTNIGTVLPDRITLFRKNLLRHSENTEDAKKRIEKTLIHEIAHHFGSGEVGARKAENRG